MINWDGGRERGPMAGAIDSSAEPLMPLFGGPGVIRVIDTAVPVTIRVFSLSPIPAVFRFKANGLVA